MKTGPLWNSSPRRLAVLLLAVAVPPAATLVWLGLQLLQQDRSLLAQRDLERRQAAAQAAVHSLELSLAEAERRLPEGPIPEGMLRLTLSSMGVEAHPADRVLWLLVPPVMLAAETRRFAEVEALEFRGGAARWRVPLTGQARKLDIDTSHWDRFGGGDFQLHPDGRQMAFVAAAGEPGAEVWALENFLPVRSAKK